MPLCIMNANHNLSKVIYSAMSVLLLLGVWETLTCYFSPLVVPPISSVARCLSAILADPALFKMIIITATRLIVGLAAGVALGLAIGLSMGHSRLLKGILSPIIGLFQTVPPVSWVVLALVWFGFNGKPAIFIVVTSAFPIIAISVYEGIVNIDQKLLQMAQLYRFSKWKRLRHIVLPSVASFFYSGLRIALGSSWKIAVMGEVFTTNDGIGGMIKLARINIEPENIIAWSIIVVFLYIISDSIVGKLRGAEAQ